MAIRGLGNVDFLRLPPFATGLPPKTPAINRSRASGSQRVLIRIRGTPSVCLASGADALLPQRSRQKYMWGGYQFCISTLSNPSLPLGLVGGVLGGKGVANGWQTGGKRVARLTNHPD